MFVDDENADFGAEIDEAEQGAEGLDEEVKDEDDESTSIIVANQNSASSSPPAFK